jgi:hypothetical protein
MFTIAGKKLAEFPILASLQKVGDLIFFEMPLLTHLKTTDGTNYLELWCDQDKSGERSILFAVESAALEAYRNNEVTLRNLLESARNGVVHLIERTHKGKKTMVKELPATNLPEEYRPSRDSYYSPTDLH